MKKNYLFYLIQGAKSLFVIGFIFFALIFIIGLWQAGGNISVFTVITLLVVMTGYPIFIVVFFLPSLLLASLCRWMFQKYPLIHILLTFFSFYGYGYTLFFIRDAEDIRGMPDEGFKYFMVSATLIYVALSEWFVYRSQKRHINAPDIP